MMRISRKTLILIELLVVVSDFTTFTNFLTFPGGMFFNGQRAENFSSGARWGLLKGGSFGGGESQKGDLDS